MVHEVTLIWMSGAIKLYIRRGMDIDYSIEKKSNLEFLKLNVSENPPDNDDDDNREGEMTRKPELYREVRSTNINTTKNLKRSEIRKQSNSMEKRGKKMETSCKRVSTNPASQSYQPCQYRLWVRVPFT